jgi:hypothetical protein
LTLLPPPQNGRDFLFGAGPRRSGDPHRGFSGWSKSKTALDARIAEALGEPLPHWTVHDLRRSASTAMADRLGVLPHIVEAILNHVSGHRAGVAGVYNRARYAAEMHAALQRWAQQPASPRAVGSTTGQGVGARSTGSSQELTSPFHHEEPAKFRSSVLTLEVRSGIGKREKAKRYPALSIWSSELCAKKSVRRSEETNGFLPTERLSADEGFLTAPCASGIVS